MSHALTGMRKASYGKKYKRMKPESLDKQDNK